MPGSGIGFPPIRLSIKKSISVTQVSKAEIVVIDRETPKANCRKKVPRKSIVLMKMIIRA
jgi:hypothetical protein